MKGRTKLLAGLAAALLMGWIWHGPAGQGAAFAGALERRAQAAADAAELPGIAVRLEREPLSRSAVVSGEADEFQREGMGSGWGLKDYVGSVGGVSAVRWDDEPAAFALPLLAETLILVAAAYLIGFGLGALLFVRRKRQSFLDD